MNIEELVRVHENIRTWLLPTGLIGVITGLLKSDEIARWGKQSFKYCLAHDAMLGLLSEFHRKLGADRILFPAITALGLAAELEFQPLRTAAYVPERDIMKPETSVASKLVSSLKIVPEPEKRDEELCRTFGSLYDLLSDRATKERAEIAALDAFQFFRSLHTYFPPKEKREAYAWACALDEDELKAGLARYVYDSSLHPEYLQLLGERLGKALRDMRDRDRQVGKSLEELRQAQAKLRPAQEERDRLAREKQALEEKLNRPVIVPIAPDIVKLQHDLDAARENNTLYEQVLDEAGDEIRKLKRYISALEKRPAEQGVQQPAHEAQNGWGHKFMAYVKEQGFKPEITSTIIRTNKSFVRQYISRQMIRKNTELRLENKNEIAEFENTFNWLVRLNVFVQRDGDAYSINPHTSNIQVPEVRAYVQAVLSRKIL
jgi:hypothetical protein